MDRLPVVVVAMAGVLFTPAVPADIDVYGKVFAEYVNVDSDIPALDGSGLSDDRGRSRIGFTVLDPLEEGLSVVGNVEFNYDPTSASDGFTDRQGYIGLRGALGEVTAGRFEGSYKTFGGVAYDPFNDSALQAGGNAGLSAGPFNSGGFLSRMIQYRLAGDSPLQLQVQVGVDEDRGDAVGGAPTSTSDGDYNVGLRFVQDRFEIIAAASHDDDADVAGMGSDNAKFGGFFRVNDLVTLYAQVESVETDAFKAGGEGDNAFASVHFTPGDWLVDLSFGQSDSDVDNDDADFSRLAAIYYLPGGAANVQFGVTSVDHDVDAADTDTFAFGFEYNFD